MSQSSPNRNQVVPRRRFRNSTGATLCKFAYRSSVHGALCHCLMTTLMKNRFAFLVLLLTSSDIHSTMRAQAIASVTAISAKLVEA